MRCLGDVGLRRLPGVTGRDVVGLAVGDVVGGAVTAISRFALGAALPAYGGRKPGGTKTKPACIKVLAPTLLIIHTYYTYFVSFRYDQLSSLSCYLVIMIPETLQISGAHNDRSHNSAIVHHRGVELGDNLPSSLSQYSCLCRDLLNAQSRH